MNFRRQIALMLTLTGMTVWAEQVHVYQRTLVDGVFTQLSDTVLETGADYTTQSAPLKSGYIFTHWSIEQNQTIDNRDRRGRAREVAAYTLYEETTLTANYLPISQDGDGDGLPDGYEIYWYGTTDISPDSDTDGDGFTFADEIAAGTDPLLAEDSTFGYTDWDDGEVVQYNPHNLQPYVIKSDPEGRLFATQSDYVKPGTVLTTPSCNVDTSSFAYWTLNGVRQADRRGRALDRISFTVHGEAIEAEAVCIDDVTERKLAYWYGISSGVTADSDTDGDGFTFAEEIAAGTNPIMAEDSTFGYTDWDDGKVVQYNPQNLQPYVIKSDPEGRLFATQSDYVKPGTVLTTPSCNVDSSTFAYWTLNGVRQADRSGRALDRISFTVQGEAIEAVAVCIDDATERKLAYWYGSGSGLTADSDTDGDGFTFAEEIAAGTNPIMAEHSTFGYTDWDDGEIFEINLQPYEKVSGAVVDNVYGQFSDYGGQIWPVVADVNGDGKWDLVVCSATTTNVYLNVGSSGNPEFVVGDNGAIESSRPTIDLAMNSTAKLASPTLDVAPVNALSATTNGATLLVSDTEGRIWLYERRVEDNAPYQLQHKVWGGSYAGFAEGLMLAAVDWEDDGDLDCICGTADGKLMLLRDPKVGRPTNVKALAGIDNVLLTWDPNAQSRVRGYRVYRATAETTSDFARIAEPPLPIYRDFPGSMGSFDYKVSSISRFYTAGNSTPTVTESPMTEAVRATLGSVKFFWNDVVCKVGENANVMLSIENSLNYNVAGTTQIVAYDPEYLRPLKVAPSGLTQDIKFNDSYADGIWTINLESGTLAAGEGKFFTLVFETLKAGTTTVGGATVTIAESNPRYFLGDLDGNGKIDERDVKEFAKVNKAISPHGRNPSSNQIMAGDFTGDEKIDLADVQPFVELMASHGIEVKFANFLE